MAEFIPGVTPIPASFAVIGDEEKAAMHAVVDSGWLTASKINAQFEQGLADFTGIKHVSTCNSGSSANLLAVAAMVEAGCWKAGDEIITTACAFPTTVNPLLLYGLVPVFVDVEIPTYNPSPEQIAQARTDKTRGIMLAHTLGNPFNNDIRNMDNHIVEDCCDGLGSIDNSGAHIGKHADFATCSFFPAHHITTGEGGAIFMQNTRFAKIAESIRDWGRDCYCEPGKENTCKKRFAMQFGQLPKGFDHKYTYTRLGFNLKLTEVQAACGLAQIERLHYFIKSRRANFQYLRKGLDGIRNLILPTFSEGASPFGFPITLIEEGVRPALIQYLTEHQIGTRMLFAGNITRQPYMKGRNYRISGTLENSDKIMNDSFWIGCHPHLTEEMLEFVCYSIKEFFA